MKPLTGLFCAAALLTGCGTITSGGSTPASTPASSANSAASAASPSPSVTMCATSALKVTVTATPGGAAAGSVYYPLAFTNVSAAPCTLFGYPGVSFVTGPSGTQLGGAAIRNPVAQAATITLAPGGAAHATLQVADAGNWDPATCHPVTAHWLRVYPPDQFQATYAHFTTLACAAQVPSGTGSQLSVSVIQPGAH